MNIQIFKKIQSSKKWIPAIGWSKTIVINLKNQYTPANAIPINQTVLPQTKEIELPKANPINQLTANPNLAPKNTNIKNIFRQTKTLLDKQTDKKRKALSKKSNTVSFKPKGIIEWATTIIAYFFKSDKLKVDTSITTNSQTTKPTQKVEIIGLK